MPFSRLSKSISIQLINPTGVVAISKLVHHNHAQCAININFIDKFGGKFHWNKKTLQTVSSYVCGCFYFVPVSNPLIHFNFAELNHIFFPLLLHFIFETKLAERTNKNIQRERKRHSLGELGFVLNSIIQ